MGWRFCGILILILYCLETLNDMLRIIWMEGICSFEPNSYCTFQTMWQHFLYFLKSAQWTEVLPITNIWTFSPYILPMQALFCYNYFVITIVDKLIYNTNTVSKLTHTRVHTHKRTHAHTEYIKYCSSYHFCLPYVSLKGLWTKCWIHIKRWH